MQREQLILKAVLLLRTVNRYSSKEVQLVMMDKYYSTEQLEDYIEHFHDPKPENSFEELEVDVYKRQTCRRYLKQRSSTE